MWMMENYVKVHVSSEKHADVLGVSLCFEHSTESGETYCLHHVNV